MVSNFIFTQIWGVREVAPYNVWGYLSVGTGVAKRRERNE